MADTKLRSVSKFSGSPRIPGDKSISHRGLIFGALSHGRTEISNILESGDVQSTARVLTQLGVKIRKEDGKTIVEGRGPEAFVQPKEILDCGNSGTTMRLMMGVLAGVSHIEAEMTGDASLVKRPMKRVATPLEAMGANFELTAGDFAPLKVSGSRLTAIDYDLRIASAQMKTAVILAAISAKGRTRIRGEIHSRDHTERLLQHFGVRVMSNAQEVLIEGGQKFTANRVNVPGDPSTAAFWLAGAALIKNSKLELKNVSLNSTRTGFIRVLERMGVKVTTTVTETAPEPIGDIRAGHASLRGVVIDEAEVPSLIDELPMLAVLATQATGTTRVRGAEELRVKETDRIEAVAAGLRAMGAVIETTPDGFIIEGPQKLRGARINSFHDHRIAMAFSIASMLADGETVIEGSECVGISYPEFFETLAELTT